MSPSSSRPNHVLELQLRDGGCSFAYDENPQPARSMDGVFLLSAIQRGLNAARLGALDLVVFDACLMASVEILSLLDGCGHILRNLNRLPPDALSSPMFLEES